MSQRFSKTQKTGIDLSKIIISIRNQQVVLDADLAIIFDVETRSLLQAFKRNKDRFPEEFCFHLSKEEYESLRSQIVISKGRGGRRYNPYVFTEHGVIMMANLLNSKVAIEASVLIVKAFVRLRRMIVDIEDLSRKIKLLEENDVAQDEQLKLIIDTLNKLITTETKKQSKIGFRHD